MEKIILKDPRNNKKLSRQDLSKFKKFSNIYDLFIPDESDITNIQSDFYNDVKFPNYDDIENFGTLLDKAERSIFAKMLDNEIPIGATVLEAGCGTGQLSIFLADMTEKFMVLTYQKDHLLKQKNLSQKILSKMLLFIE